MELRILACVVFAAATTGCIQSGAMNLKLAKPNAQVTSPEPSQFTEVNSGSPVGNVTPPALQSPSPMPSTMPTPAPTDGVNFEGKDFRVEIEHVLEWYVVGEILSVKLANKENGLPAGYSYIHRAEVSVKSNEITFNGIAKATLGFVTGEYGYRLQVAVVPGVVYRPIDGLTGRELTIISANESKYR